MITEKVKIAELEIDFGRLLSDTAEAKKRLSELTAENARLRKETDNLSKATQEQSLRYSENELSVSLLRKEYARKSSASAALMSLRQKEIEQLKSNAQSIDELRAQSGELIKVRNVLDTSTKEGAELIQKLNKQIDSNTQRIKAQVSAMELSKMNVGNYTQSIKNALMESSLFSSVSARLNALMAPLKDVFSSAASQAKLYGKALFSCQTAISRSTAALRLLKLALISSGVGVLIVALGALLAGFSKSQKAIDYFERKLAGLKAAFGVISDACVVFADVLVEAIEHPKQAWGSFKEAMSSGFRFIKAQVLDRFEASFTIVSNLFIIQLLKMKKAWFDFTGQADKADEVSNKIRSTERVSVLAYDRISKANEELSKTNDKLIQSSGELGKAVKALFNEMKKEATNAEAVTKSLQEMAQKEMQFELKQAFLKKEIAEYRLKASDERLPLKKRQAYLKNAEELEKNALDQGDKQIERLRLQAAKKAHINLQTLEDQKRFAELEQKARQGTLTQKDTKLGDTKEHEAFVEALKALSEKEAEILDKQRQKREQASEALMRKNEVEIEIYRLSNEKTAQSLEERFNLEDELHRKKQSLLDKKYSAQKITQEEYQRDSLNLDMEHKGKKAQLAMDYIDKEITLFDLQHRARLKQEKTLTKQIVEEGEKCLDELYKRKKALLEKEYKEGRLKKQEYNIELFKLDEWLGGVKKSFRDDLTNKERIDDQNRLAILKAQGAKFIEDKYTGEQEAAERDHDLRIAELDIRKKEDLERAKETKADIGLIEDKYTAEKEAAEREHVDKIKKIDREKFEQRLTIASDTAGALADLLGKETDAGKAAAIAQATINTYMGATKALATLPPPMSWIAVGATIVAGLASVKKIISTDTTDVRNKSKSLGSVSEASAYKNPARAAKGGLITLKGPSHAQGGINLYDGLGRSVVNAEGDEKVAILNKRASRLLEGLSFLNQSTGGVSLSRSVGYAAAGGMISREILTRQRMARAEIDTKDLRAALSGCLNPDMIREAVKEGFDSTKVVLFADGARRHLSENERLNQVRHV